jgi:hypothetical protein
MRRCLNSYRRVTRTFDDQLDRLDRMSSDNAYAERVLLEHAVAEIESIASSPRVPSWWEAKYAEIQAIAREARNGRTN